MSDRRDDPQIPCFNQAAIRRHLAELCEAVATTEDEVAATFGHLAETRPRDAARLRARAAMATQYARLERNRAARYRRSGMQAESWTDPPSFD